MLVHVAASVLNKDQRPLVLRTASADAFLAIVNCGAGSNRVDKDGLAALHCTARPREVTRSFCPS